MRKGGDVPLISEDAGNKTLTYMGIEIDNHGAPFAPGFPFASLSGGSLGMEGFDQDDHEEDKGNKRTHEHEEEVHRSLRLKK